MSVATFAALLDKMAGPTQRVHYVRNGTVIQFAIGNSSINSEWVTGAIPQGIVAPTTAAVCDRTTLGALGQSNKAGSEQRSWLERFDLPISGTSGGGMILLVDRLAHCGGLDGTVTTAQSNGAWPALTRFTNGLGVWGAAEVYTGVGATATTATFAYTNNAGGASTSTAMDFGGTGRNAARKLLPFSLASGDKGVKAITSVTLAATTGTAGVFGLTMFKTLGAWSCCNGVPISPSGHPIRNLGPMPVVPDDACLQLLHVSGSNLGATTLGAVFGFFED